MTTATGDFSKNFRDEPDNADYTDPSFTFALDGAEIEAGLIFSPWASSPRHVGQEALLTYYPAKSATIEKNSPSTNAGSSGPALIDNDGQGYELGIIFDELRIFKVVAWDRSTAIGAQINFTYPGDTRFTLAVDDGNNFTAYADGDLLPFDPVQDSTYAAAALRPSWYSDREESGGGFTSGIYSFAADGVASSNTIDSIDPFIFVGSPINITTSGLTDLTTATTVGGKAIASANAPDGDGTITPAGFVDGQTYPAMGPVNVVARDGIDETAPTEVILFSMPGWQFVNVTDIDTGPWSLGKAISGDTIISQAHAIDDGTGVLNEDLTLTNWALGSYTAWMRDQDGIMHRLEFTVTQTGVTTGAGFVQFVEFVGFIQ